MKLADALSLRKSLAAKVAVLQLAEAATPQVVEQRIPPTAAPDLDKLVYKPLSALLGEAIFYRQALLAVETEIEAANYTTTVPVQASIFQDYDAEAPYGQTVNKTLAQLLRRRTYIARQLSLWESMSTKSLAQPDIKRITPPDRTGVAAVDVVTIRANKYDSNELRRALDYYAKQQRLVDSHVQHANWTQEVAIDERWTKSYFEVSGETQKDSAPQATTGTPPPLTRM